MSKVRYLGNQGGTTTTTMILHNQVCKNMYEELENKGNGFKLEYIKFYPDIKKDNSLSYGESATYGYIRTVIELSAKDRKGPGVCFTSSKEIGENIGRSTGTIDSDIKKLHEKGLIDKLNYYNPQYNRNTRYMYLPGEAPKNKDDRVDAMMKRLDGMLKDNRRSRAILGNLIYKRNISEDDIYDYVYDYYENIHEEMPSWEFAEIYPNWVNPYQEKEEKIQIQKSRSLMKT